MNINTEALQNRLEERARKGRTPLEAAGETRWLTELERSRGLLSNETLQEVIQVIDEWLATKMNLTAADVGPYAMMAAEYARFLGERVSIDIKSNPTAMIDNAWREWRETRGRA